MTMRKMTRLPQAPMITATRITPRPTDPRVCVSRSAYDQKPQTRECLRSIWTVTSESSPRERRHSTPRGTPVICTRTPPE